MNFPQIAYFQGILEVSGLSRKKEMVPQAGLEPARLSAIDFESTASTISPLGHVSCLAQQMVKIARARFRSTPWRQRLTGFRYF